MASISGKVIYSQSSYANVVTTRFEIKIAGVTPTGQYIEPTNYLADIPVTIWSQDQKKGVVVKTDDNGNFGVINVPIGKMYIVETYGVQTTNKGNVNFNEAQVMDDIPVASDPNISYINQLGLETYNGNRIASITQNTFIINIDNTGESVNVMFIDAPMKLEELDLPDYILLGDNAVISVDYGTIGVEPVGTPAGTSDVNCPYNRYLGGMYTPNDLNSQFYSSYYKYGPINPQDGQFSIVNIANAHTFSNTWFDIASLKKANEEERFMVINGDFPNRYFFKETVKVEIGKNYLFSIWISNINRIKTTQLPKFNVTVRTMNGTIIFNESISDNNPLVVTDLPTWNQIGAIIPQTIIGNNSNLIIECVSMGPNANGNDYCIDDIKFCPLKQREIIPTVEKTQKPETTANINEKIEYTTYLNNVTEFPLNNIIFIDNLQYGTVLFNNILYIKLIDNIDNVILSTNISITAQDLENGINISQIIKDNINNIINNSNFIYNQDIVNELTNGNLPPDYKISLMYSIKVPDGELLAEDCLIYNISMFNYKTRTMYSEELIDSKASSNETKLLIDCPKITYNKSAAVIRDGFEIDLENGESILCGEQIVYKITVENSSINLPTGYDLYDNIPENLIPVYTLNPDCSNGISTKQISPVEGTENFLSCSQIENVDGNVNHIKLPNLNIPAADIINGVLVKGIVVVRIYCNSQCES